MLYNSVFESIPEWVSVIAGVVLVGIIYSWFSQERPFAAYPLIAIDGKSPKQSWMHHARETLAKGLRQTSGPFQIMTGTGPKIVLPARYADEIKNHPALDLGKAFRPDFFINYPGFEGHKQSAHDDKLIQDTVRIKLTQSLGLVTGDLVDETVDSINCTIGPHAEWSSRNLKDDMMEIVARLSSRVFLGQPLCRNRRWLDISKAYTIDTFIVAHLMRLIPSIARPIAYWFIPQSATLRRAVRDAHKLIDPEVQRRIDNVREAQAAGRKPPKVADSLGWMYQVRTKEGTDYVAAQLALTMAAIHTTTETSSAALLDICEYPEVAEKLRAEIIQVIGEHGWSKTSLYKLTLMDSFLKESQRVRPLSITSMNRYMEQKVTLSDGTVLPKGSRLMVAANFMDPEVYREPEKFDAGRFVKKRQESGQENAWQLATTSSEYTLFGHGHHACPGRFFAINELKILLCHLLLKYEWRFNPEKGRAPPRFVANTKAVAGDTEVQCKSRTPEIDLDCI
ncbi:cytochrome P450 [Pestalotiopsis sp. NC0098]|nr:cytochrome P450 [Pestalotiopsis sp. NC0098]